MSKAIIVPNSKSTKISDEFLQNYPIRGDNNNLTNRLTPYQQSIYDVSKYTKDTRSRRRATLLI